MAKKKEEEGIGGLFQWVHMTAIGSGLAIGPFEVGEYLASLGIPESVAFPLGSALGGLIGLGVSIPMTFLVYDMLTNKAGIADYIAKKITEGKKLTKEEVKHVVEAFERFRKKLQLQRLKEKLKEVI